MQVIVPFVCLRGVQAFLRLLQQVRDGPPCGRRQI